MALALCLTLLPTAAFAEGADGGAASRETITVEGGQPTATGAPTEGGGQLTNTGEGEQPNSETDMRTEICCVSKPDSIGRSYDGTTDGGTIPIDLTFTDGTNEIKLKEGTGFTAKKTFDSADAGWHTVTVEIALIGEAAVKYKLKAGEEKFEIGGNINKAYPDLTVSLSKPACTAGEKLLPLLSISGAPKDAEVTYYYLASALKSWAGSSDVEGSEAMPKIDENTAISEPGTYYVYAKTGETTNYKEERSTTVELTVNEAVVEAASITKADGTDGGTYESLPAALNAAQDGDTVKLLANHTTNWSDVEAGEYSTLAVIKKTLTLDLNGRTVDYLTVGEVVPDEAGGILDSYDGKLTVVDNIQGDSHGKIKNLEFVKGSLAIQGGRIGDNDGSNLTCDGNSGTVTISGGTVCNVTVGEGASVTVSGGSEHAGNWHNDGTLNITGGTFGNVTFCNNGGTIAISGGTFSTIRNTDASATIAPISLLAPDYAFYKDNAVQDGNATELTDVTVKEHIHTMVNSKCACGFSCTHKDTDGTSTIDKDGKCTVCGTQFAAGIGETYYTDVKSALDAAADGQTVKLLANGMLPDGIYVSKTLTLDLNGHSLSGYSLNVGGSTATGQALTGNLTVIDSSGGNGAVGVTVRDGGTLVFDPENDSTTLLQLEVWGGKVELHGGKILRKDLRLNNSITLGDLLPQKAGLAYYCGDTQLTLKEAASKTCDLVVKSCAHGGKNGFDKSATTCPYCGAPAVAETALNNGEGNRPQRRFADLQTALDADRYGGAELTLLTDVTDDYTIDGTQDTGLNLNGHSIKGTVTVKAAAGNNTTTLSNTKNITTASIDAVVACKGAKLAGSGKSAVIGTLTLTDTTKWKDILQQPTRLGFRVTNADGTYKWYAPNDVKGSQLNNVIINSLPITTKTLNLKVDGKNLTGNSPKVERGTTVQLCASCNTNGATVEFSILKKGETTPITLTKPSYADRKYTKDYSFDTIGEYTIYFTATKDGYSVTSTQKKLTVTKPNLSNAEITFRSSNESTYEPYNSTTTAPGFTVTYNGKTLRLGVDYTASGTASSAGVSTQTLTIKAVEGSDYTGSKTAEWRIVPHKAKVEVGDVIKAYDGTTDLPDGKISLVSAAGSAGYQAGLPLPLSEGNGFELTDAKYDSANASETEKNISFTVKLTDTNYTFEDGTTEKAFTLNGAELEDKSFKINKAAAPTNIQSGTLNIINGTQQTYTYDFKELLPELSESEYGTISYGNQAAISLVSQSGYYYDETIVEFKNGVLILAQFYAKDGNMTGQIGTVKVKVTTTNYEDFQLTLVLNAVNQIKPTPGGEITAAEITYGDALSKSTILGKMKDPDTGKSVNGTFAWTDGTIKPNAGDYEADWTFTPAAGYEKYATATGTVTIKVKPAKLTVSVKASRMYYTGEAQIASIIASGQSVDSTPVTFTYSDNVDGNYTSGGPTFTDAGTYTVYYKAEAANHEPATGTFTVTIDPLPISLLSVSSISKTYDGSADVTLTADKLTFFSKTAKATNIKLPDTVLSFSNAQFTKQQADGSYLPSPEVGGGKALSFTMMLTSNNYVFEGKSGGTTEVSDVFATDDVNRFTITKAAAPTGIQTGTLNVINGTTLDYTFDFNGLLPTLSDPKTYGAVSYTLLPFTFSKGYYFDSTTTGLKDGELLLASLDATGATSTGEIGTITVKVSTGNYEDFTLTLNFYAVDKIAPVVDGGITASDITYGQTLSESSITGKMKNPDTGVEVEGTLEWTAPSTKPNKAGDYEAEWVFTPEAPEYATVTGKVTVKVSTAPIIEASVSEPSYTYDGNSHMPSNITVKLADGTTLVENTDYTVSAEAKTDAGTYEMKIIGIGNYHGGDSKTYHWRITPRTVNVPTVMAEDGVYNGGEAVTPTVTVKDGETVIPASEYEVTYSNNTNAGTATVTVKDVEGGNYVLSETSKTFEITKAAGGSLGTVELTQKYTDTSEHTYTPDWSELPTGQTWSYNSEYSVSTGSTATPTKQDFAADGSLLTYAISGGKAGDTVTITLKASCNNYENFTITLTIALTKKDDQKPLTITGDTSVIYGEKLTLTTTGGSGTGAVTYRVDTDHSTGEATIDPNTGVLTPVKVGSVSVIATKAGDKDYNDVTSAPFVLMIKPATPTGEPKYTKITTSGKTLADAQLTVGTITPAGTISWDAGDTQSVAANTAYNWTFKPTDTVNYNNLTGSITPYTVSHSGGGGGSYNPTYAVVVDKTKNGDITASPKAATKGTIVTLTIDPDKGYELDALEVLDKNGDRVKLTEKNGKYTFVMPASKVIVKGSFAAEAPEQIFFDVPVNAYYYNAVKWAADKGITGGVSPTLFAPDQPCTRAQIVTFLWRAAGSPAPKAMSAFVDVSADAYYAKAVAWAVENGITGGTGDGKFSPDATCTRAQAVTFLYRASGSPAVSGSAAFSDVATDAYYASAVKWAEKNGITGGIGNGLFGSGDNCTRAQIVTFLYRAFNK